MNSTKHVGNLEILLVVVFECCPPCRVLEDIQGTFTLCVGCRLNDISGLSLTPIWNLTACDPSGVHNYEIMNSTKDKVICACAPWMSNVRALFLTLHFSCLIEGKVYNHQVNPEVAKSLSYGLQRWGTETGQVFPAGQGKATWGGLISSFRWVILCSSAFCFH